MLHGRWSRIATGTESLLLLVLLSGCSPENQVAVAVDEQSRLPMLVLNYCEGEGVTAVRLAEARIGDQIYEEERTLWRIEAAVPRAIPTVVTGQVPAGFREVVSLPPDLPDELVMMAENDGGVAAEQGGGAFLLSELEPGVLLQEGSRVSAAGLRRAARENCSSSFFGSLGLPAWLDKVSLAALGAAVIAGLVLGLQQRSKDSRRDRERLANGAGGD